MTSETVWVIIVFLSTLSLRRATDVVYNWLPYAKISIHALLAESDHSRHFAGVSTYCISIHALLAESDAGGFSCYLDNIDFYPRSPCGERRY